MGLALLLLATGGASAQENADPKPSFRSGVQAVTVEVGVSSADGTPVADLGPDDFVVTVAGKPRRVVSVSFVGAAAAVSAPQARARLPISSNDGLRGGRLVLFVVDQNTLAQSEVRQVASGASRLLERLTPADRSALVLMPVGAGVPFTSDHASVQRALMRATGSGRLGADPSGLGLEEVRAIASGDFMALQSAANRECPLESDAGRGSGTGGGQTPGGGGAPGGGQQPGGNTGTRSSVPSGLGSMDSCTRRIQFEAQSVWQQAHSTALASVTALHSVLADLRKVGGEKTVLLISGGWPLQLKEASSDIQPLADLATEAGATIFGLYAASAEGSAERRTIARNPLADEAVRRWPLQTLAAMTGGESYRVDVGAAPVFERLARELSGFYMLGVQQEPSDVDRRPRSMKVGVTRPGTRVRAPERFVVTSYAERDLVARLDEALRSPLPSTGLGVRLASYLTTDPEVAAKVKVLLVGDAYGLQPGAATFQLLLQDARGGVVGTASQPLGDATSDRVPFTTSVSVAPGRYVVRVAVMDASGVVGSVDHVVEARHAALGALSTSDLMLARVPAAGGEAVYLLDGVSRDERLALQLDLTGDRDHLVAADVLFEIATSEEGPALMKAEATLLSGRASGLAQAVTDVRVLPPGQYVARARIRAGGAVERAVTRPFLVTDVPRAGAASADVGPRDAAGAVIAPPTGRTRPRPPFAVGQVLALSVLGGFLDRLSARPDAASPSASSVIAQLRDTPAGDVTVPEGLGTDSPVVANFATGLSRLARAELDPAAQAFRAALRASADFYPAMVYLGACFAAGGKDQEAAGAWQTALIGEGDVPALHLLLVDALLRLDRSDAALAAAERARSRWPDDPAVGRRFAMASFAAGRPKDALAAIDRFTGHQDDEPLLMLALETLYESITTGHPIETLDADRARLTRYAEAYRRLEGPSLALVDTWVAAATKPR